MTPEQLIDQLADVLGVPGNAQRLVIERDWQAGFLRVQIETHPTVDEAEAESIIRAAQDFTLHGPSPVQAASSAFADHMAMQQAAIAQSMSMPADVVGSADSNFELRELGEFRQSIEIQTGS